ncbi:MAG: hypothetical protein ABMA64_08265, partial [Myxococcota bacterium]
VDRALAESERARPGRSAVSPPSEAGGSAGSLTSPTERAAIPWDAPLEDRLVSDPQLAAAVDLASAP